MISEHAIIRLAEKEKVRIDYNLTASTLILGLLNFLG